MIQSVGKKGPRNNPNPKLYPVQSMDQFIERSTHFCIDGVGIGEWEMRARGDGDHEFGKERMETEMVMEMVMPLDLLFYYMFIYENH